MLPSKTEFSFPELYSHPLPFHLLPTTAINAISLTQPTAKIVLHLIEMLLLRNKYSYNTQWEETFPPQQAGQEQRIGLTPCQEEKEGSLSSFIQEDRGHEKKEWPCLCQGNRLYFKLPGTSCRHACTAIELSYFENNL